MQKELQLLRTKANDAELQLKKNDKIRALEEEKEWYRKEALRLDKFSTQLKSELKFLRAKLEDIDEDRQWCVVADGVAAVRARVCVLLCLCVFVSLCLCEHCSTVRARARVAAGLNGT